MKRLVFSFVLLMFSFNSFSSHLMGGEITWKCIKSGPDIGKYIFTMKVYRDCSGITVSTLTQTIQVWNHPSVVSFDIDFLLNQDVSPVCDPTNSGNPQLDCASGDPGSVEEYIFESQPIQLPGVPPNIGWQFTWDNCCRNAAITNILNPSSAGFTLRASMYPFIDPSTGVAVPADPCFDSSPEFKEQPKTILCTGFPFSYSHNAADEELDELIYSWGEPLDDFGLVYNPPIDPLPLTYNAPYTISSPLPGNPTLDPTTGEISYDANVSGNFVTCVKVQAWRCNQLVAEIFREVQVVLISCPTMPASPIPNNPPTVGAPFIDSITNLPSFDTTVYAGALVEFSIDGIDGDLYNGNIPQELTMEVSGGQFADDFLTTTNCLNPPCATFNNAAGVPAPFTNFGVVSGLFRWQTSCNHIAALTGCGQTSNIFTFLVKVYDDFCPANGLRFATIKVTVLPLPIDITPDIRCVSVQENGNVEVSWEHIPSAPASTVYSLYHSDNENGPFTFVDSIFYPNNTYMHSAVNANTESQYYYLTSLSSCADESAPSDTLKTIKLDVVAINVNTEADLNWNEIHLLNLPTSFAEYNIYALDGNADWQNVGSSSTTNYIFPAQTCNSLQLLYISLEDDNGCISNSSIDGAILKDTISPNKPVIDDVSVNLNGKSVISWSSSSTDVDVYAIYIQDEFGAWITIDSVYGFANNSYEYISSNADNNYETFSVRSIDSCGNASSRSIMHNSMNIVSNVDVCDLSIYLNWNEYINFNNELSHYKIYINTTDIQGNIFEDSVRVTQGLNYRINNIQKGYNYYFYIAAFNGDSSIVAISDQVNHLISLPLQPNYNYIDYVSVNRDNNNVEISCLVDNEAIIDRYLIFRSLEDYSVFSEIGNVSFNNSSNINYTDKTAEPQNNYYQYQVYPVDTCNNIIQAPSVYQVLNDTSYGQTIHLSSEINVDYSDNPLYLEQYTNTLTFNEYDKWLGGVSEYQLFRSVNRGEYDVLPLYIFDRINNPEEELKYIDIVTEFGAGNGRFCYYIQAIEGNANPYGSVYEGSYSNISCVSQTPILFVPTSFTPNGDEHNEIFKPITNFVSEIGYEFSIYSRSGLNIFTTNNPLKGWDGTYLGKFVQNDNYVYHISYINGVGDLTEKVQIFTLIR
tara:strand:+ start:9086 stop:12514 length:3429 start_codon:yes stop_codon:yes gene_type:complete